MTHFGLLCLWLRLGSSLSLSSYFPSFAGCFVGFAYQGKDTEFRLIIEYSSLMDFGPEVIGLFLYEDF